METHPINDNSNRSEGEVAGQLTVACERQLETFRELLRIHNDMLGPLNDILGDESDSSLRLRKVYCHVGAITWWVVDEWSIHALAPDMRAAFEQLRPLVRAGVCAMAHEPGEECGMPRCFDHWDGELAPFTHPTMIFLTVVPEAKGDKVKSLILLCGLLHALLRSYAMALDVETSPEEGAYPIHDMVEKVTPWAEIEVAGRYFRSEEKC